jgi:5-methylcytosine-specific restriction endonuclease McrA
VLAPDLLICIRCRQPIDKRLPWPHRMSKTVDHIRDLADGGDPLDPANLGPAHLTCNSSAGARGKAARRARQTRATTWVHEADP